MNPNALTKELTLVRQQIQLANRQIVQQRERVADARCTGKDAAQENLILTNLKSFRAKQIERRDRLKRELGSSAS